MACLCCFLVDCSSLLGEKLCEKNVNIYKFFINNLLNMFGFIHKKVYNYANNRLRENGRT